MDVSPEHKCAEIQVSLWLYLLRFLQDSSRSFDSQQCQTKVSRIAQHVKVNTCGMAKFTSAEMKIKSESVKEKGKQSAI